MAASAAGEQTGMDWIGESVPERAVRPAASASRDETATRRVDTDALWQRVALVAILALAAFLNIFRLNELGLANTYYAAAVKSMLMSWHNFFFVSFDPGGFVSVDKPPLGFWIQAASAKVFGFSGLSLLLPQAVAGVLSVMLVFYLVRRVFGPVAGLLAGLALAVTPVAVAVNRNNTIDSLLVLTLLGAVWAVTLAVERNSLRWLLLGSVIVGLGFNIKMLQAYLVVPALFAAYLVGTRLRFWTRIAHLAAAMVVLLVVSFSWAAAVDLTPKTERPYVGSSQNNTVVNLVLGYNGLDRMLPQGKLRDTLLGQTGTTASDNPIGNGGFGTFETGAPSPLRLFNENLGGQIGWLLPLAVVGLLAAWWQTRTRLPLDRRHQALVLWGGWFVTAAGFFSYANMFHRYYLVMLGAPTAALAGAGLAGLWRDYRRPGWRGWLLPATVAGVVAVQVAILADYDTWSGRLTPALAIGGAVAVIGLVMARLPWGGSTALARRALPALAMVGLAAMLTAPTVWAGITTWDAAIAGLPAAGPASGLGFGGFGGPGGANGPVGQANSPAGAATPTAGQGGGANGSMPAPSSVAGGNASAPGGAARGGGASEEADARTTAFLLAHQGNARYLLATTNAMSASPYILATGKAVAALGGFIGQDPILTNDELAEMIAKGEIRYFLVPSTEQSAQMSKQFSQLAGATSDAAGASQATAGQGAGAATGGGASGGPLSAFALNGNARWVNAHCTAVPADQWNSQTSDQGGPFGAMETLFDCGTAA